MHNGKISDPACLSFRHLPRILFQRRAKEPGLTGHLEILSSFDPISLDEMDGVKLMERTDTKFLLNSDGIPELLENMKDDYRVLEIKGMRAFDYNTLYLDTPDYLFFNQHMTGKMGRYKVRVRTYKTTGRTYLEVKYKSNKGRTYKYRIRKELPASFDDMQAREFLGRYLMPGTGVLQPSLTSLFTRITLVSLKASERITIDYNIAYQNNDGDRLDLPFLAIVELKKDKASGNSPLLSYLKKKHVRQTGFSKYCIGAAMMYDLPHKNAAKPRILMLNKIKNEFNAHLSA